MKTVREEWEQVAENKLIRTHHDVHQGFCWAKRCAQDWKLELAVLYTLYNDITCGT